MSKLSVVDFIEWMNTEHAGSDKIDNDLWSSCAVGHYLHSKGIQIKAMPGLLSTLVIAEHSSEVSQFQHELEVTGTVELADPYQSMEEGEYLSLDEYLNLGIAETYGDLLDALPPEYTS